MVFAFWLTIGAAALESIERPDPERLFDQAGVAGTFVLFDVDADQRIVVNAKRADRRFFPASTFKIANSLIALDTGVVIDENEIVPFDGKPQPVKAWEKDMSMRQAIAISNVPVYQELARRIGLDRYKEWLATLDYGNRTTGDNVENFWLVGPLTISAVEQVEFLARLARQELAAATGSQLIVRDIIRVETKGGSTLYAKSGWSIAPGPQIGWIEHGDRILAFAMNLDVNSPSEARLREPLARAILKELKVWPPAN